jgi:hypothetical protein
MLYLIAKAVLSGIVVALASEVARRSSFWGALILSLPLISLLAILWLWRDTGDVERIATLAQGTFLARPSDLALLCRAARAVASGNGVLALLRGGMSHHGGTLPVGRPAAAEIRR